MVYRLKNNVTKVPWNHTHFVTGGPTLHAVQVFNKDFVERLQHCVKVTWPD